MTDWLTGKTNIGGKFCSISENPNAQKIELSLAIGNEKLTSVLKKIDSDKDNTDQSRWYDYEPDLSTPLLVKSLKSSQKTRDPYGKHGITNYGKKFCKNTCILLQRKLSRFALGFGTATLPEMSQRLSEVIIANWGDITRRFCQKLKRIYAKVEQEFLYVGCTEIQEKRFKKTGVAVPHLHFVYNARDVKSKQYIISTKQAYEAFNNSVNEVLKLHGHQPIMGVGEHKGSVKLEAVKKSAAAYIGKYISKGAKVVGDMIDKGYSKFPKQWWFACMQCKKMFKESLAHISNDISAMLFYDYESLYEQKLIAYVRPVWITVGGYEYRCGLTGTLSDTFYKYIVDACKKEKIDG